MLAVLAALPATASAAPVPAGAEWQVVGERVTLPFLTHERTDTIQGHPGTQLEEYLSETITVQPETLRDSADPGFNLPPAQQP